VTFRYIRKQRLGTVQMGHVLPYILNAGGDAISPYFVISGFYRNTVNALNPLSANPTPLLPVPGGGIAQLTAYVAVLDRATLDVVWAACAVPRTDTSTLLPKIAPVEGFIFAQVPYTVQTGVSLDMANADGTPGLSLANPVNSDVRYCAWSSYDLNGQVQSLASLAESYPATLATSYAVYSVATRDAERVVHVQSMYRGTATTAGLDNTYYAKGQAAETTFGRLLRGGILIGSYVPDALDDSGVVLDTVQYTGAVNTNAFQLCPVGISRQIRNDFFAFCGLQYTNGNNTAWNFNYGRASALTYTKAPSNLQKGGWVVKYQATNLVAQWWAQLDNGGASGDSFTPTNTDIALVSNPYAAGAWTNATVLSSCDIVDDGSVVAGGSVVFSSGNAIVRNAAGVVATVAIPVISGTNRTHGVLFKLNAAGTAVDWFQYINATAAANFNCTVESVTVRADLDAVFVLGQAGSAINFNATAGNAGNGYTVGGAVTARGFNAGATTRGTGWFVARYRLSTGALEWVYTARSSGNMQNFNFWAGYQFLPNSFVDIHDGLVVCMVSNSASPAQTVELDPEGPSPTSLSAQTAARGYLVKLSYNGALMAFKDVWTLGDGSAVASAAPVTLLP